MWTKYFLSQVLLASLGVLHGQKPSHEAAIIKESRYLSTGGQFGASYSQEDGVEFSEEADSEGNRKGSYTYIDPNGQRRTVTYTAGKDGFHATGDHLPVASFPVHSLTPVAPVPQVPGVNIPPVNYQIQSHQVDAPTTSQATNNFQQVQLQALPVAGTPLFAHHLFQTRPALAATATSSSTTPSPPLRHYPPGKLNVKHTSDGFSYTFNSIV